MPAPINHFKTRLKAREVQIGLWLGLGDPSVAELAAGTGYDWLLIDGEHGPNGLRDVLGQLRAIGDKTAVVVRTRDDNRALIKQMLDLGAQTLLIPMIDSAAQAAEVVRAMKYPPEGVRGVGAALARVSGFGRVADYVQTANDQICVLVQVESRAGLAALDDILKLEGIDGVFIGPADLAADMGFAGHADTPEVVTAIKDAITRIRAAGKAAGFLATVPDVAQHYHQMGVEFLAVGSDVGVLRAGLTSLRGKFA